MKPRPQDSVPRSSSHLERAYIIGGGIAALASAVYLIRAVGVPGISITLFEQDSVFGGCLDGSGNPKQGYLIRGGRMMEEHFVCTWDLFSQVPALNDLDKTIMDDFVEFNKTFSAGEANCRLGPTCNVLSPCLISARIIVGKSQHY